MQKVPQRRDAAVVQVVALMPKCHLMEEPRIRMDSRWSLVPEVGEPTLGPNCPDALR